MHAHANAPEGTATTLATARHNTTMSGISPSRSRCQVPNLGQEMMISWHFEAIICIISTYWHAHRTPMQHDHSMMGPAADSATKKTAESNSSTNTDYCNNTRGSTWVRLTMGLIYSLHMSSRTSPPSLNQCACSSMSGLI